MADFDSDEVLLAELRQNLRAHPPELVREAVLKSGAVDTALSVLQRAALDESSSDLRATARRYIEELDLGLLLSTETDELG